MSFGEHLRNLRLGAQKSLRETARFYGLSDVEYGALECDVKVPKTPPRTELFTTLFSLGSEQYFSGDPCPRCGSMSLVERTRTCVNCGTKA